MKKWDFVQIAEVGSMREMSAAFAEEAMFQALTSLHPSITLPAASGIPKGI